MELLTYTILVVLLLMTWYILRNSKTSSNREIFPPGPRGIALITHMLLLLSTPVHVMLANVAKKWGEIFSMNIFGQRILFLSSPRIAKEAFVSKEHGDVFAGRPRGIRPGKYSKKITTFLQPSEGWLRQRKLIQKVLKTCGEREGQIENTVESEMRYAIKWLEQNSDQPINIDSVIHSSAINFITIMLLGKRQEYDSNELENVIRMDAASKNTLALTPSILFIVFPFLKYIPIGPGWQLMQVNATQEQFVMDYFKTSKDTYDPNVSRGMVDDLFRKQDEDVKKYGTSWLSDASIKAILVEMIVAGTFTIRSALCTFFLMILHKPEVAKRIQDEIDAAVGTGRFPTINDREEMPYTEASIYESLRYFSHVPLPFPRTTTNDVKFRDYVIPASTIVQVNTWAIHHDETLWTEPWEFRPERFLGEDGNILPTEHKNRRNLLAFSLGRRVCPGEAFARARIFEFITLMLQRFNFYPDVQTSLPSVDPRMYKGELALIPPKFYLRVEAR